MAVYLAHHAHHRLWRHRFCPVELVARKTVNKETSTQARESRTCLNPSINSACNSTSHPSPFSSLSHQPNLAPLLLTTYPLPCLSDATSNGSLVTASGRFPLCPVYRRLAVIFPLMDRPRGGFHALNRHFRCTWRSAAILPRSVCRRGSKNNVRLDQ
jgi:hypothetical protein